METERFIEPLVKKYQQAPGFPFLDWATDAVSFYALMNLWDDLFKTAAGTAAKEFEATLDVRMDPDSPIYDVTAPGLLRRVKVVPEPEGGTFHFLRSSDQPETGFRSELGFATDIEPRRLSAAFEITRAYMTTQIETEADLATLDAQCVDAYADRFGFSDYDPFRNRRRS